MKKKLEKSELTECLLSLGIKFKKNKNIFHAIIPENINLSLDGQTIKIVAYIYTKDLDVPNEAIEPQIKGFSISFQKLGQHKITLSKQIEIRECHIELKDNSIYIHK